MQNSHLKPFRVLIAKVFSLNFVSEVELIELWNALTPNSIAGNKATVLTLAVENLEPPSCSWTSEPSKILSEKCFSSNQKHLLGQSKPLQLWLKLAQLII